MAYLGKSPSQGVRNRYYFTASGGETSISGALTGGTLTFTDGNYVDVNLNGVTLVAGTDYNTSTANTIAGLSALTASDVVEIVVYDVFSVFSGNVNSDFSVGGNLSVTGTTAFTGATTITGLTTTGDINFGDNDKAQFGAGNDLQIYHDGSASRIVDSGTGGLTLQADANVVIQNSAGTETKAEFTTDGGVNLYYDNSPKIATLSTGASIAGKLDVGSVGASGGTAGEVAFGGVGGSIDGFRIRNTEGNYLELSAVSSGNKMVLTNTGNVSIGTSSALGKLHSHKGARNGGYAINGSRNGLVIEDSQHAGMSICGGAGNGGTASIAFPNGSSNIDGLISYNLDGRYFEFHSGGSERLRILSGGGLTFNGDTAAANALDDYEEGTWTPTASGGYTVSSSSGAYTKIGRVVHLWGTVQFSAVGGNTSTVVLGSAPFTNSTHLGTGVCRENTNTGAIYVFRIAPNSTSMEINTMTGVTAGTRTIRTGENYAFHGSYYVA